MLNDNHPQRTAGGPRGPQPSPRRRATAVRRTAALAAAVVMAVALAGCGDDEEAGGGQGKEPARPLVATYVGRVSNSEAFIALNSDGGRVGGYLCDGQEVSVWLGASPIEGGRAQLLARRDNRRLGEVTLTGTEASGTVEVAGRPQPFTATAAAGEAGLYRKVEGTPGQPGFKETGWIVLNDGSERGNSSVTESWGTSNTRTEPAPKRTTETKFIDPVPF